MSNVLSILFGDIAESIRDKTGGTDKMSPKDFPAQIDSITVGSGVGEGCVTVTFMNGDSVIFTRPVYIGDDCPNPVTQGRIETPTKESTVDKVFTYSGWTSVDGGTVDSSILNNITEDKVIYSAFTESVRYYTVSFYDGETLLKTEQVAYGGTSSYTHKKDNYLFNGWTPEPTNVTSDMNCYGSWEESYSFADASWEYIAQMSESGRASEAFAVGDTRIENINNNNYTLEIIGFDHDEKADGSGKAGLTIWCKNYDAIASKTQVSYPWFNSILHTDKEEPIFDLLSTELQSVVKPVNKQYAQDTYGYSTYTGSAKIWSLSAKEINSTVPRVSEGSNYAKFSTSKGSNTGSTTYSDIATGYSYWLRSPSGTGESMYISSTGQIYGTSSMTATRRVAFCFCV